MWRKRDAQTPVAFALQPGTLGWSQFLGNVAAVDRVRPDTLANQAEDYLKKVTIRQRKQSRTELDLHLSGASVKGHETSASDFGRFVANVSACVASLVMHQFGLESYESRLKVVGAQAGSVRVQFREPEYDDERDETLFQQAGDTPESVALLRLAQIVNAAQDAAELPVDAQLDAVLDVPVKTNKALHELSARVFRAGWRVDGLLLGLQDIVQVSIGTSGAWRLMTATAQTAVKTRQIEAVGELDGWSWSKATMTLLVADSSRPYRVAVPPELQTRVAELNATQGQKISVKLQVFERQMTNSQTLNKAYSLLTVEPVERLV